MTIRGIALSFAAALLCASAWTGAVLAQERTCDRASVSPDEVAGRIADDLKALAPEEARDTRYFSLVPQLKTCATSEVMQLHRHAVVKLLNSLSWSPDVMPLETIGEDRAIVRVRLSRLGWTNDDWLRLLRVYPYALKPHTDAFAVAKDLSGSALPYIRGDWFVHTVSRPPYYYVMLKLPRSLLALKRRLGDAAAARLRSIYGRRGGYEPARIDGRIRLVPTPG